MAFADALAWALAEPAESRARGLADAYTSGTTSVAHDGQRVEYASMRDIERALTALHEAGMATSMRRPRATIARVGDGFS